MLTDPHLRRGVLGMHDSLGVMEPPRLRGANLLIGTLSLSHSGRCKKKTPLKSLTPTPCLGDTVTGEGLGLGLDREESKAYRDHSFTAWKPASYSHPHGAAGR